MRREEMLVQRDMTWKLGRSGGRQEGLRGSLCAPGSDA